MNTEWRETREDLLLKEARDKGLIRSENDECADIRITDKKYSEYTKLKAGVQSGSAWDRDLPNAPFVWGARKDIIGLVPEVLAYWYDQRLIQKAKMEKAYEEGDIETAEHYNRLQHVKKIQLNSAYGALGNRYSHFFNLALAECTTLGGQGITKHMMSEIGLFQDNNYDINAGSIIYGDTDSCYFEIYHVQNNREAVVYADHISETVNKTFKKYMIDNHNCDEERALRIQAGREVVADRSLFVDKKRYAMHIIDNEGKPTDKIKVMGLEVKQSSTPVKVQIFLGEILEGILRGETEEDLDSVIRGFREDFFNTLGLEDFGMPKGLKGIEDYNNRLMLRSLMDRQDRFDTGSIIESDELNSFENRLLRDLKNNKTRDDKDRTRWDIIAKGKKISVPGHVQASMNWNQVLKEKNDRTRTQIVSGMKIRIYYLKPNPWGFESISIPTDEQDIPGWFRDLPFDLEKMGSVLIDQKLKATYQATGWKIPKYGVSVSQSEGLFEF